MKIATTFSHTALYNCHLSYPFPFPLTFPSFYKNCGFCFVLLLVLFLPLLSKWVQQFVKCLGAEFKETNQDIITVGSLVVGSFCSRCLVILQQSNCHSIFSFSLFCLTQIFLISDSLCGRNLSRIASSHSTQGWPERR